MKREKKETFTYSGRPSVRKKAMKKAKGLGLTLSEVIDHLLTKYSDVTVYNPQVDVESFINTGKKSSN